MKQFCVLLAGAAATLFGAAIADDANKGPTDAEILNYALTLEHLENAFYKGGLKNYTRDDFIAGGFKDPFYENLKVVAADEQAHVDFLSKALSAAGAKPAEACQYTFPSTDAKSFVALANVLEGVGVSAYLGAAAHITSKDYLTAAGSILTVEARHSAYIRASLGQVPYAQPFDNPLSLDQVYTLAAPFFASCPSTNPALPVKAFPSLSVSPAGAAMAGSTVTLTPGPKFDAGHGDIYAAFITVTGPVFVTFKHTDNMFTLQIPSTVSGQSYVVLTSSNSTVSDDNTLAGPAIIEIGAKLSNSSMTPVMNPTSTGSPTASSPPIYTGSAFRLGTNLGSTIVGVGMVLAIFI